MKAIQVKDNQLKIQIQVQPRSSKVQWGNLVRDEWVQLKVTAPPVNGAANKACVKFISGEFKAAKSNVTILKGEKSRYKIFQVVDYSAAALENFLKRF
jgi:uncharacterized protein